MSVPYSNKKLTWVAAALVALAAFIIYLPAMQNGFVNWDDHLYVSENRNIRSLDIRLLRWSLTAVVASLWHPLTMFSLALDYATWGLNPFGYHLTNILFHTFNTLLVFILVVRLIECQPNSLIPLFNKEGVRGRYPSSLIAASVTALLFGIHPLHVESVAWVSERKDVLCAFFFLLSLLAYLSYARSPKRRLFYAASLVSFSLALMSKPMAVSLPLVLLILDFYPLKRLTTGFRGAVAEKLPFFVLSVLSSLVTVWAHRSDKAMVEGVLDMDFNEAAKIDPVYADPYCNRGLVYSELHNFQLALKNLNRCIELNPPKPATAYNSRGTVYVNTGGYHQAIEDFSMAIKLKPGFGEAYYNRGTVYRALGDNHQAINDFNMAISLNPQYAEAYNNRGNAYRDSGKYSRAIEDYSMAIKLNPGDAIAHKNRGIAYLNMGKNELASEDFNRAGELTDKTINPPPPSSSSGHP